MARYRVTLQIRLPQSHVPDELLEKHFLLETDDREEVERFVVRLLRRKRLGDFDDPPRRRGGLTCPTT